MRKSFPVILLLCLILISCTPKGEKSITTYRSITMDEASRIFQTEGSYIILDVRRPDEFSQGHIRNAINIPNEEISDKRPALLDDTQKTIYVYCRSGRRSREASQKLVNLGYVNIIECGGILDFNGELVL